MNFLSKWFYHTWNIGFIENNINNVILNDDTEFEVNWLKHKYKDRFFADPFILSINNDTISVLVEDFPYWSKKGLISLLTISRRDYSLISKKVILRKPFHMSYPFVQRNDDGCVKWVAPEASMSGNLYRYKFNAEKLMLMDPEVLVPEPLVDSTIIKYNERYWLFCTKRGEDSNSSLYIYYSYTPEGPWMEHKNNPVIHDAMSARPAGSVVEIDKTLYRVTQKCDVRYGESIMVSRIDTLSECDFKEVHLKEIRPKVSRYSHSFHTINGLDNICVVDGLTKELAPFRRVVFELINKLSFIWEKRNY